MFYRQFIFLFLFMLISCNDSVNEESNKQTINSKNHSTKKITNSIGEVLNPKAIKFVEQWDEYKTIDEVLIDFYNITTNDALSKAKTLSDSAQQLKDSIRIKRFKENDIKIRLNVLYNHTLRLSDMASIQKIDPKEVSEEISTIISAYSALNSKINNIVNQESLEKELIDFKYILN